MTGMFLNGRWWGLNTGMHTCYFSYEKRVLICESVKLVGIWSQGIGARNCTGNSTRIQLIQS